MGPIVASLVAALTACPPAARSAPPNERVMKVLEGIDYLNRTPVWPGYRIDRPILLYVDGQQAYLLGATAPPRGFVRARYGTATVYERSGPLAGMHSDYVYHFDLEGVSVFALRVSSGIGIATEIETLFHEYFHDFQEAHFSEAPLDDHYLLESAENQVMAALEQLALAAAMRAGDQRTRARFARMFVAIRAARNELIGGQLQELEDAQERIEGTADYVGKAVRWHVAGTGDDDARAEVADALRKAPSFDDMVKARAYATGHAQGWLVDFGGITGWKARVAAGASLRALMWEAYPVRREERSALIEEARAELMGYRAALANQRDVLAARLKAQAALLEQFEANPGLRVHVGSVRGTSNISLRSAGGHTTLDDGRTLHAEVGVLDYQHEGSSLKFRIENRMLIEGKGYDFRVPDELEVTLDGARRPLRAGETKFRRIELKAQGFSLSGDLPGELRYRNNELTLTWEPPAEPK